MGEWVEARVVENKRWNERLFSLYFEAAVKPFKAGQFVRVALDINGERVGRPYSCVNTPEERPFEIYFNIVEEGPLSPRLAALQAGDRLWAWDSGNGLLTIDAVPAVPKLWMFATGTGVGPFLAILKSAESWTRFQKLVLVHAVRFAEELTFQETIQQVAAERGTQFVYLPIVSREPTVSALTGRIPTLIESGEFESRAGVALDAADSHVMMCGNSGMIKDTSLLLEGRGMKKHTRREPGHISTEKYH